MEGVLREPWSFWALIGRLRRPLGAVLVAAAVGVSGSAIYVTTQGTGSAPAANFSGTFDCYGSEPNCAGFTPKTCSSTIAANTLQTALNNATGGEVICLNTGSTGSISLSSKTYSTVVTVQPASTAAVAVGNVTLNNVKKLQFSGVGAATGPAATMTMADLDVGLTSGGSQNLTFDHITFVSPHGCVGVESSGSTDGPIVFDHNRHDDIEAEGVGNCYNEGRFGIGGSSSSTAGWITVTNSHFGGSVLPGCSDGIQLGGNGAVIGPGNEFGPGIDQPSCVAHVDSIQYYCCPPTGSSNNVVTGNYFHDNNASAFLGWDGGDGNTFTNNVFECHGSDDSSWSSIVSGTDENDWLLSHNVFYRVVEMNNSGSGVGTGNVVRDSVFVDTIGRPSPPVDFNHDLNSSQSGTGNINGTPVFADPTLDSYYDYELDSSSPGYHAASDGKSMGICDGCGS